MTVDCGFGLHKQMRVRLAGVDTHEIFGVDHDSEEYKRGRAEVEWVFKWCKDAESEHDDEWPFILRTLKDDTGKYGRYLADVYRRDTGESLVAAIKEQFDDVAY